MTNATEFHATHDAGIWPPPASAEPDVVDYGAMNRELLAEKLVRAYSATLDLSTMRGDLRSAWLRVVDVAIAELQGTINA